MTQNKELLLKDLCARLPYGVLIVIQDTFKYSIVSREYHVLDVSNFSDIFCFNYKKFDKRMKKAMRERPNDIVIKPYLFPLSSMTAEQREELYKIGWYLDGDKIYSCFRNYDDVNYKTHTDCFELINWCYKNKLDINGFIPMGLALDATGLNIY